MKRSNIKLHFFILLVSVLTLSSCYKLQKDYDYVKHELDPHINMTATQYLYLRSDSVATDTIFRWMKKGIIYAGIDTAEYSKPNRTYIFLHNNAIKVWDNTKKVVTGGFFYDYPVFVTDASGNRIKSKLNPSMDSTRPANDWSDYSKETVRNYLMYLIIEGQYGFDNLTADNTSVQTLLPAGKVALKESMLGYLVSTTTPNPDPVLSATYYFDMANGGNGYDPEGKMNLKLVNNTNAPIEINDRTDDRSAGYFATNGFIHVYDKTVHPFRYSHL